MKRSKINGIIEGAIDFFSSCKFYLPEWAYWPLSNWEGQGNGCREIIENNLGWDITDFGSRNFQNRGLILFTIRNGDLNGKGKTYCEKIMVVGENQETPLHRHWKKTEDIINRGGGDLVMELYLADRDNMLSKGSFEASIDGISKTVIPGQLVVLSPGQSICLRPEMFHRFYGKPGKGRVLVGEVSTVNDDENDNCFYEEVGRFPEIDEDTSPEYLLVSDYPNYIK